MQSCFNVAAVSTCSFTPLQEFKQPYSEPDQGTEVGWKQLRKNKKKEKEEEKRERL